MEASVFSPSVSAWAFPVVIARNDCSPRLSVDYRNLNRIKKPGRWPIIRIDEIFDKLTDSDWFTTLDLFSGYW